MMEEALGSAVNADIARNVKSVLERIRRAAERAGRCPDRVRLVAATKSVPVERIRLAIEAGVTILGENRVQEALPKINALGPRDDVSWHFIGRLQRRKVKQVIGRFQMIHSVDSLDLAAEIDRRAGEAGLQQAILIEVNVGGEASKAGFAPDAVAGALKAMDAMPHLAVRGLMALPPLAETPEAVRPYFRAVLELARSLRQSGYARVQLDELSMGMSGDFEVAVEEGATLVRVGTALFGPRPD